jgi:hypothetical protein
VITLICNEQETVPQAGDKIFLNFALKHAFMVRGKLPMMIRNAETNAVEAGKIPIRCSPAEAERVALEAVREAGGEGLALKKIPSPSASFSCFELVAKNRHDG